MAGLADITTERLRSQYGVEVDEIVIIAAKHDVTGQPEDALTHILGCTMSDLQELKASQTYKHVRQLVATEYLRERGSQTELVDSVEVAAWKKLNDRIAMINDPEFLLKVAAVSNRATRRTQPDKAILDAMNLQGKTTISLTKRLTQRLTSEGDQVRVEEHQFSITQGSKANPTFSEVGELLGIGKTVDLKPGGTIKSETRLPTNEELIRDFLESGDA